MTCRKVHTTWFPISIRANQMLHRLKIDRHTAFLRAQSQTLRFTRLYWNDIKKCKVMKAASRRNDMTCSLALFLDNAQMIMKRCKFDYHSENQGQIAIDIGQGYIFISGKDKFWTTICRGKEPHRISSCALCIVSLPCSCSLVSKHFYILARINQFRKPMELIWR